MWSLIHLENTYWETKYSKTPGIWRWLKMNFKIDVNDTVCIQILFIFIKIDFQQFLKNLVCSLSNEGLLISGALVHKISGIPKVGKNFGIYRKNLQNDHYFAGLYLTHFWNPSYRPPCPSFIEFWPKVAEIKIWEKNFAGKILGVFFLGRFCTGKINFLVQFQ